MGAAAVALRALAVGGAVCLPAAGCVPSTGVGPAPPSAPVTAGSASPASSDAGSARRGTPAASQRIRFEPAEVILPGGARADVRPAQTVNGELVVPENVRRVGWWDGSAYAGDPFGSVVIAGHVDSASQGVGFFARLLEVSAGDEITLSKGGHQARYRVRELQTVAKQALAAESQAFDQTGDHRLVLITCTGAYVPSRGGYASNLVVIAEPVGPAH